MADIKTKETLLYLVRLEFTGEEIDLSRIPCDVDWEELCSLSIDQGVVAFVVDALGRIKQSISEEEWNSLNMERKMFFRFISVVSNIENNYDKNGKIIASLAKFYAENGIKMMLLKGMGLSFNYPIPKHRPCGDIDIYLFEKQRKADILLTEKRGIWVDNSKHHHTVFYIGDCMVENHYDFLNIYSHLSNRDFEKRLKEEANNTSHTVEINGQKIYIPTPNMNALFLIRHMAMHFASEKIVIRHILDYATFVQKNTDEIDWNFILGFMKEQNMFDFVCCITQISVRELGFNAKLFPSELMDEELPIYKRVLSEIISPEFSEESPVGNPLKLFIYRFRRWWHNQWKHKIVYKEGLLFTFLVQIVAHMMKPKSMMK